MLHNYSAYFGNYSINTLFTKNINPILDWEGAKKTGFSPVASKNIGISSQKLLLVLTLLPYWCKISRQYLVPVPNY